MGFTMQVRYGDISATMSTDQDYQPLLADDIAAVLRREILETYAALTEQHANDTDDLELDEATVAAIAALLNNNDA
jgi:hypothetical protein